MILCLFRCMVDAVRAAVAIMWPEAADKDHGPCVDWKAPDGAIKTVITHEVLQEYFMGLHDSSLLGRYMDTLTKLYALITCGSTKIDRKVRDAICWLTYAVNVLVDAAKHGGLDIEAITPEYVKQLMKDGKLPVTAAKSKENDGKEVDAKKVEDELGHGVLDTLADLWVKKVPKEFKVDGCDYNRVFDPRCLLSKTRVEAPVSDVRKALIQEDHAIKIWNFTGEYKWYYVPYLRKDGNVTPVLAQPSQAISFSTTEDEHINRVDKSDLGKVNRDNLTEYFMVVDGDTTIVKQKYWVKDREVYDKKTEQSYTQKAHWEFRDIPGKWMSRETKYFVTDPVPYFCCLEQMRHEIENQYETTGDAYDRMRVAADRAESRKFTSWAVRHEAIMYGALYGATADDVLDKLLIWALRPRGFQKNGRPEQGPSPFAVDLVFDAFSDKIISRAKSAIRYNMVKVRFATSRTLYGYLIDNMVKPGTQVVVPDVRGGNQIVDVIESCQMTEQELEAYAYANGFDPANYKWAKQFTA